MDWYLDGRDPRAVSHLRRDVTAYLARHCEAAVSDIAAAELIVSELLGNVTRHAPGPAWVSLTWSAEQPTLVVNDLGPGFDPATELRDIERDGQSLAEHGRGLLLVAAFAPVLERAARARGGTRVAARLPVTRREETSFTPGPRITPSLPDLSEAQAGGGFGTEAFLRALVVELAQAIEGIGGPRLAEQVVGYVGSGVGSQMEDEYRAAKQVAGRLSVDQLGDAMVRLKHAIDGRFTVVEATNDRIVLTNTQCPFGDAVKRAPALCRMTSSVFGGLAARNSPSGTADVVLEERIAVGDPGCRVVVNLRPDAERAAFAHRYVDHP